MKENPGNASTEYARQGRRHRRWRTARISGAALTISVTLHWLIREAMWAHAASNGLDLTYEDFDKPSQLIWSGIVALIVATVVGRRVHIDNESSPTALVMPVVGGTIAYGVLFFLLFNTRDTFFI